MARVEFDVDGGAERLRRVAACRSLADPAGELTMRVVHGRPIPRSSCPVFCRHLRTRVGSVTRAAAALGVLALIGAVSGCASRRHRVHRPLGFAQYSASLVCPSWHVPDDSQPGRLAVFVSDEMGAAMSRAKVSLEDGSGRSLLALIADEVGAVRIEELAPGRYGLAAEHVGFATALVPDLEVAPGCLTAVVVPLRVGGAG